MAVFSLILCFFAKRRRVITYEYSGAYRACSVTNGRGGPVGQFDDHRALLLSALAWRGVLWYNYTLLN